MDLCPPTGWSPTCVTRGGIPGPRCPINTEPDVCPDDQIHSHDYTWRRSGSGLAWPGPKHLTTLVRALPEQFADPLWKAGLPDWQWPVDVGPEQSKGCRTDRRQEGRPDQSEPASRWRVGEARKDSLTLLQPPADSRPLTHLYSGRRVDDGDPRKPSVFRSRTALG